MIMAEHEVHPSELHVVIMAGGRGERFWPLSTVSRPKPFVRELFQDTLFRLTMNRVLRRIPPENVWIVAGEQHVPLIKEEAPEIHKENILVEPESRDTAAAIGYAAFTIRQRRNPQDVMVVLPCDHYIEPFEGFWNTIDEAVHLVRKKREVVCVIGIPPTRPETGYGYIEIEDHGTSQKSVKVRAFHEKPDFDTAFQYLESGRYFWNAGMFVWSVGYFLHLLKTFLPDHYNILDMIFASEPDHFPAMLRKHFKRIERISVDYGIMEKTKNIYMVPAQFSWDDIGQWEVLDRFYQADEEGNRILGDGAILEAKNVTLFSPDGFIGVVGVDNIIVVKKGNRVVVMKKGQGNLLKKLLQEVPDRWKEE